MLKKFLIFLLLVLVAIQFIHPKHNESDGDQSNYIGKRYTVPANVQAILTKACNDCHSNNTSYPWYCTFQPVDWWINKHVRNGKKGLNLDEYLNRSLRSQYHKLEEIAEQVKENKMPLNSYTWIHKDAILTDAEKATLINWTETVQDTLKAKYPIDSLIRKK